MDDINQAGLTEQMLDGMDFMDDGIELASGVNVQGFAKQDNNGPDTESADPDEEEIDQNIEPTDPDEEEIDQNIEPTDLDEENREMSGIGEPEDDGDENGDENEPPEEEDERTIIWSIADMGRAMRDALENGRVDENAETDPELEAQMDSLEQLIEKYENGQSTSEDKGDILDSFRSINSALENNEAQQIMYIRLSELAGRAETKMFPEEQEELDEDEEELSDDGFGEIEPDPQNEVELPKGDPELIERLNALEQLVREYDPENREKILKAQDELWKEATNFTPEMTRQYANIIKDYGQVSAEKKPMEAAAGSDIQPGKPENAEVEPENAKVEPEHAGTTLERFNEEFELLMHSFEFESFGDFLQIPTDGSELNEEQKKMQLKLADAMEKARTALRVGPEDTDPESMLKWCERVGLLSGRVSSKVDLYRRAGQGNSEEFLAAGDEWRMDVAEKWISLFNDFPEQRANLFEYNGVSKIEKPNEIISKFSGRSLTLALNDLDESYERARFAREFDKSSWSRANAAPEAEKPALVSLDENAAKSFRFVVQDDYLKKLNPGELQKQLKELQKELKATDPFWVWTNTERFTKLKEKLDTTLKSLDQFGKKQFKGEHEKNVAKAGLLADVRGLADLAQEYTNVKAGNYASSNKSRDLRRGQAAAKILAFTSAYVVNDKVEAMGMTYLQCKENCENTTSPSYDLRERSSSGAADMMYSALTTAMKYPPIPGCQDKLALAYTNTASLSIGTRFGQYLDRKIQTEITGEQYDRVASAATREQEREINKINEELDSLRARAVQVRKNLAAKAKRAKAPVDNPAPIKSKDPKVMGNN